jgi:hypothetical protein
MHLFDAEARVDALFKKGPLLLNYHLISAFIIKNTKVNVSTIKGE